MRLLRAVWRKVSFAHRRCLRRISALERALDRDARLTSRLITESGLFYGPGEVWKVEYLDDVRMLSAPSASAYCSVPIKVGGRSSVGSVTCC